MSNEVSNNSSSQITTAGDPQTASLTPEQVVEQLRALRAAIPEVVPLTQGHYLLLVVVFVVWGIAGFGMMTPQQSRLVILAPAQAPILLSLNSSMLYIGTALGAAIGGALAGHIGFDRLAWIGVPFALAGLATLSISHRKSGLLEPA